MLVQVVINRGKSRYESRYCEGKCKYCKKERHCKVDCPKLKNKKEKDLSDEVSVAKGVENVLLISTTSVSDAWILDSGCTYNICPNWDWSATY